MIIEKTNKVYSQGSEQLFIMEALSNRTTGKFIDVGSYDVFRFSNVRALYETGNWYGVFVEPAPKNFRSIADHYAADGRITVLNIAVGEPGGTEVDFYESDGDAVGTTDEAHMKKWGDAGVKYTKIKVPQMGVVDFFEKYGHGTDFLSIDTEATNINLFRHIPDWVFDEISLFCIEHDGNQEEIEGRLREQGFSTLYTNAENIILSK